MEREAESTIEGRAAEMRVAISQWIAEDARRTALAELPGPTADVDEELAVWLSLPDDSKAQVRKKLLAFNDLRSANERGKTSQLSSLFKTSRANIYRLMGRMSAVGPVTGLDTQRRAAGDPTAAREGFGPPMDAWLEEIVSAAPEASLSTIRRQLQERMSEPGALPGLTLPPQATLSRRVNRLKLANSQNPEAQKSICANLLIDHCLVNIGVGPGPDPFEIMAMFAIDRPTRIVCAMSVFVDDAEEGLVDLVGDFADRTARIAQDGARFTFRIDDVTWQVPPAFAETAEQAGVHVPASRRPRFTLLTGSKAGTALVKLMDGRIGLYYLRATSNADDATATRRSDGAPMTHTLSLADAAFVLGGEVDRWNAERLSSMGTVGSRGRPANVKAANELSRDLGGLFETTLPSRPDKVDWGGPARDRRAASPPYTIPYSDRAAAPGR
jgi:hypothetical protein